MLEGSDLESDDENFQMEKENIQKDYSKLDWSDSDEEKPGATYNCISIKEECQNKLE